MNDEIKPPTTNVSQGFTQSIPQGRALIYIMILCLIPSLIAGFYFYRYANEVETVDEKIESVRAQAMIKEKRQSINQALRTHFKETDPFYIDKQLETLTFLEPEVEAIQNLTKQKNFPEDETIKRRLDFLTSSANAVSFTEGVVQNYGVFQETTETLSHGIEVNLKDLHKLLTRIEGVSVGGETVPPGRPQLIILDFKLDKKKSSDKNEVFLLNMKLLKREFL